MSNEETGSKSISNKHKSVSIITDYDSLSNEINSNLLVDVDNIKLDSTEDESAIKVLEAEFHVKKIKE